MSPLSQRAFDRGVRDAFQKYAGIGGALLGAVKSPLMQQVGHSLTEQAPQLAVTAGVPLMAKMLQPSQPPPQAQPALSPGA